MTQTQACYYFKKRAYFGIQLHENCLKLISSLEKISIHYKIYFLAWSSVDFGEINTFTGLLVVRKKPLVLELLFYDFK